MGLAVLPARLKNELVEVEKYLLGEENQMADYHLPWADEMHQRYDKELTTENVNDIVQKEVGHIFLRVLEDAGVFKRTEQGQNAFKQFIATIIGA
jgi:UDPglucose--hexose-1-phosphate uridylyltransferase